MGKPSLLGELASDARMYVDIVHRERHERRRRRRI
jgi:hypothetical protein